MKLILSMGFIYIVAVGLFACANQSEEKRGKESFEDVLNDPRVNSKEVGEREGIKYFQVEKDGKTGFRDLDGNVVIEPKFDMAEMFSEGFSSVTVGDKHGFIDETGKYVLPLQSYEYFGSLHNGLASVRINDKAGFVNIRGEQIIKPQFDWVGDFSEGLCVIRNDNSKNEIGKYGYIDTTGNVVIDFKFQYANNFENGRAKVEINNLWGAIDKTGTIVEPAKHQYTSGW